jgi:hypothetical protein
MRSRQTERHEKDIDPLMILEGDKFLGDFWCLDRVGSSSKFLETIADGVTGSLNLGHGSGRGINENVAILETIGIFEPGGLLGWIRHIKGGWWTIFMLDERKVFDEASLVTALSELSNVLENILRLGIKFIKRRDDCFTLSSSF